MSPEDDLPDWRLPDGVNRSLWAYSRSERLADDEDSYFGDHPLFAADTRALDDRFRDPAPLIDLGCGAGRLSIHFARRGFRVVAVDLSRPMLRIVGRKARTEGLEIGRLRANLCRLGAIPDGSFAYALSMFSTLGMIRGAESRRQALRETFRILRPGGRLALHAHNLWLNLGDPQGLAWLASQGFGAMLGRGGIGDRKMTYRGIPGMEVHLYRWKELREEISAAGFAIDEVLPIDAVDARVIPAPRFLPTLRAGGWLVFARRPEVSGG